VGSILFIVPSVAVLYLGLKVLGTGNKLISISMIVIILALILASIVSQDARLSNLWLSHWQYVVPVFIWPCLCSARSFGTGTGAG
jgi:uncharacterized protein YqgC (DUF456 family)